MDPANTSKEDPNQTRIHQNLRQRLSKDQDKHRDNILYQRRKFTTEESEQNDIQPLRRVLQRLNSSKFQDRNDLLALKRSLSKGTDCKDDFFSDSGAIHSLVSILDSTGDTTMQLLALHCVANLAPVNEKNGLTLARSAGPILITLLASGSQNLREAAGVALGNLALASARVMRVLLNQEVIESLVSAVQSPHELVQSGAYYALYHILHAAQSPGQGLSSGEPSVGNGKLTIVIEAAREAINVKAAVELYWVLFVLSCDNTLHSQLVFPPECEDVAPVITKCLDICTYEIFQKADSRPLVKIVTPIVRLLANLSAGPFSERAILLILRHPDLHAILMALLGTNFTHLSKECLWLFGNMVNSESVEVQEELIDLELMDRLEYHTAQAILRLDPYMTNSLD